MSDSTTPTSTPSAGSSPETTTGDPLHAAAEAIRAGHPEFDEVPVLEVDETVPPRPEEDVADADRV